MVQSRNQTTLTKSEHSCMLKAPVQFVSLDRNALCASSSHSSTLKSFIHQLPRKKSSPATSQTTHTTTAKHFQPLPRYCQKSSAYMSTNPNSNTTSSKKKKKSKNKRRMPFSLSKKVIASGTTRTCDLMPTHKAAIQESAALKRPRVGSNH